jgi:hypothetical protein
MTAITAALQPLQALARKHNTAVAVIMRVSKYAAVGSGGDSTRRRELRHSGYIPDAVDFGTAQRKRRQTFTAPCLMPKQEQLH